MTRPAPETQNCPRCIKCQSVALPSSALYWHIGETTMRIWTVRPRRAKGWKSALVMERDLKRSATPALLERGREERLDPLDRVGPGGAIAARDGAMPAWA